MVPWLEEFSKKPQPDQSTILKFFPVLKICDKCDRGCSETITNNTIRALKNLDLSALQKLKFSAQFIDYSVFSTLNTLFAGGCFVNLTELRFRHIDGRDHETLIFTHMPSLKLLELYWCEFGSNLILAEDIKLSSLIYEDGGWDVEKFTPLLTQARGLEYLSLCYDEIYDTKTKRDLIAAIIMHKDTLRELRFRDQIVVLDSNLELILWSICLRLDPANYWA